MRWGTSHKGQTAPHLTSASVSLAKHALLRFWPLRYKPMRPNRATSRKPVGKWKVRMAEESTGGAERTTSQGGLQKGLVAKRTRADAACQRVKVDLLFSKSS